MGKTTTSLMFKEAGAAVFDADACVHDLYAKGGAAVPIIKAVFPDAIKDGAIDRGQLSKHLQKDPLHIQVLRRPKSKKLFYAGSKKKLPAWPESNESIPMPVRVPAA